jgi:hypothetical protein
LFLPVEEVEDADDDEHEGDAFLSLICVTLDDVTPTPDVITSSVGTGVMISSIRLSLWLSWEELILPLELLQSGNIKMSTLAYMSLSIDNL